MKKFLGFICLIYSSIIVYVWAFDKIKYFLSPTLSIYLKIALFPLLIIGIILIFSKNDSSKFKISDLVLFLPLLMIVLCGNSRLNSSLANNRILNTLSDYQIEISENRDEIIENNFKTDNDKVEEYDFSKVDFDVVDEAYSYLTTYFSNTKYYYKHEGQTIKLRGFVVKSKYVPNGYFAIGKYEISCCAADAGLVGFISRYDGEVKDGSWVEIEGVLETIKSSTGKNMIGVHVINLKEIDESTEELYVYPCYAYDDEGSCKALSKYTLY